MATICRSRWLAGKAVAVPQMWRHRQIPRKSAELAVGPRWHHRQQPRLPRSLRFGGTVRKATVVPNRHHRPGQLLPSRRPCQIGTTVRREGLVRFRSTNVTENVTICNLERKASAVSFMICNTTD